MIRLYMELLEVSDFANLDCWIWGTIDDNVKQHTSKNIETQATLNIGSGVEYYHSQNGRERRQK